MTALFKDAYGYDLLTNAFTGTVLAFLDPLASETGMPVYTLPANATWIKPEYCVMPAFARLVFVDDKWKTSPDYDALRTEIGRMRGEAEAKIWSMNDVGIKISERIQSDPQDESLQAEFQNLIAAEDEWKQYRQALLRMEEDVETLDVSAINWPKVPDLQ